MNANVVSGGGRGRGQAAASSGDEGSLSDSLMSQSVNETVYLGRASFRITHEMEAADSEGAAADASEWFSHEQAVILKGGPNGVGRDGRPFDAQQDVARGLPATRKFRRAWLLVALPVGAFALGIVVASAAGPRLRRHAIGATSPAPAALTAAPVAAASPTVATTLPVTPPPGAALPPSAATAPSPAAPPASAAAPVAAVSSTAVPVAAVPVLAPAPVAAAAPATTVAATALPPSTVAMAPPVEAAPSRPVATADVGTAPTAPPRPARAAAKPHVARKANTEHLKSSGSPSEETAIVPADDEPASQATTPATPPKKAAVKWVDPWAN